MGRVGMDRRMASSASRGAPHRCSGAKGTSDRRQSLNLVKNEPHQKWRSRDNYLFMPRPSAFSSGTKSPTGVVVMRVRTGLDVLEYEIRQEQAATIGRLARELRDALDALDTFDRRASSGKTAPDSRDPQRVRLVDAAV